MLPYIATTTTGQIKVMATNRTNAILIALELSAPGAKLLACVQEGDW
jgi:hypothetical protein